MTIWQSLKLQHILEIFVWEFGVPFCCDSLDHLHLMHSSSTQFVGLFGLRAYKQDYFQMKLNQKINFTIAPDIF